MSVLLRRLGYRLEKIQPSGEEEEAAIIERGREMIRKISPHFRVLNGLFTGMQYPSLQITEAALVPKLVGSYESQLQPLLSRLAGAPYSEVIDVGCAEGYYAVGLARSMPQAAVHGFDINEKDLAFCRQMMQINAVHNLSLHRYCSPETLISFPFTAKGLIFCDCEGYELELFTPEVVSALHTKNVDVLVELHDVLTPGITSKLMLRFSRTHDVQIISTHDKSAGPWKGLENLPEAEKTFAVFEHRGGINQDVYMEWAFFSNRPSP